MKQKRVLPDSERGFEYGKINVTIFLHLLMRIGRYKTNNSINNLKNDDQASIDEPQLSVRLKTP